MTFQSILTYNYLRLPSNFQSATNNHRIITKSFVFDVMEIISQANMRSFAIIPIDHLMNFFDGIFDKLYLRI